MRGKQNFPISVRVPIPEQGINFVIFWGNFLKMWNLRCFEQWNCFQFLIWMKGKKTCWNSNCFRSVFEARKKLEQRQNLIHSRNLLKCLNSRDIIYLQPFQERARKCFLSFLSIHVENPFSKLDTCFPSFINKYDENARKNSDESKKPNNQSCKINR